MTFSKIKYKISNLSLAKLLIILFLVSVVAIFIVKIINSKKDFETRKMYYSLSKDLNAAVLAVKSNSYVPNGDTKRIPTDGPTFCNSISDVFITVGTKVCSESSNAPESRDFKNATPSFVLKDGVKIFNAAAAPLSITVTGIFSTYTNKSDEADKSSFKTACDALNCSNFDYNTDTKNWISWKNEIMYEQAADEPDSQMQRQYQQTIDNYYASSLSYAKSNSTVFKRLANNINKTKYSSLISMLNGYNPPAFAQTGMQANAVTDVYIEVYKIIDKIKNTYAELTSGTTTTIRYYDIFADVNGDKGNGKIGEDVFEFYITEAGYLYPKPDTSAPNDASFISARIKVGDKIQPQKLSYIEALCRSGLVESAMHKTICSANNFHSKDYSVDTAIGCNPTSNLNICSIKLLAPGY